jgi:plasmid stabilization system protein ParE
MKAVRFHSQAALELEEAADYYEVRRRGLGRLLLDEVEQRVAHIRRYPSSGAPYKETTFRHAILNRFPYILFYMERSELLWIVAVAHAKRRPGYWQGRSYEGE